MAGPSISGNRVEQNVAPLYNAVEGKGGLVGSRGEDGPGRSAQEARRRPHVLCFHLYEIYKVRMSTKGWRLGTSRVGRKDTWQPLLNRREVSF